MGPGRLGPFTLLGRIMSKMHLPTRKSQQHHYEPAAPEVAPLPPEEPAMPKGEHFKNIPLPSNGDAIFVLTIVTKTGIQKMKWRSTDFLGNTHINQRTPEYFQAALESKIGRLKAE